MTNLTEKDNESKNENIEEIDPDEKEKEILSFREKLYNLLTNITVEPCVLMFIGMLSLSSLAAQNLSLEKACRVNLNFSAEACSGENEYEKETQEVVAQFRTWRTLLSAIFICLLAVLVGSFCDKTGHRKLFMIIPMTGQLLLNVNHVLNVYFFYETNLQVLVFTDAVIEILTGEWNICVLVAYAYICTITSERERTFRVGIVSFCIYFPNPIGMGVSGLILRELGYYGVYGITISVHSINLLYTIFVLKDPKKTPEQKQHERKGFWYLVRVFFDFSSVKDTAMLVLKKTPNNRRVRLSILLVVGSLLYGPMFAENNIMYMYVRYRFQWDELQYGLFQVYNLVANSIGMSISILVLAKYLGWHDTILGVIAASSQMFACIVYGLAPNSRIFLIGPAIDILNAGSLLAIRSLLSKIVERHELGKQNSLFGMVENLSPLIYLTMFLRIYTATMETFPGAVFLTGMALRIPAVAILLYYFYEYRKNLGKSQSSQKLTE